MWFLYLVLKSFSVGPTYVSEVLLSVRVTVAWYMIEVWRQLPLRGHECFCRQLHFLLSIVLHGCVTDSLRFQYALVVVVCDLFRVVHVAVTYLDSVSVEYFSELMYLFIYSVLFYFMRQHEFSF